MRVVAGTCRGRRLREPENEMIRPTTDRVKEALFSIIQFSIPGAVVLDMFGGTGQLAIEALSRGAEKAVIVDASPDAVKLIRQNLKTCGLEDKADVVNADSTLYVKNAAKYDLVFLDPPYDTELLEKALKNAIEIDILKDNGIIICETRAEKVLPDLPLPYRKGKEYRYGKIKLTVYVKSVPA